MFNVVIDSSRRMAPMRRVPISFTFIARSPRLRLVSIVITVVTVYDLEVRAKMTVIL